jgi:hypothetical protein
VFARCVVVGMETKEVAPTADETPYISHMRGGWYGERTKGMKSEAR